MLQSVRTIDNKELVRTSLIRGRFMEQLAGEIGDSNNKTAYFVTGTFSEIDNILSRDMDDVLEELALHVDVKDALLGVQNPIRKMLDKVILFETNTEWKTDENTPETLTADLVMEKYIAALGWVLESGYN